MIFSLKKLRRLVQAFALSIMLLIFCSPAGAYQQSLYVPFDKASGVDIVMSAAYENWPMTGFMPIQVRIENSTKKMLTYTFQSVPQMHSAYSYAVTYTQKLVCPAESIRSFDLYVPVPNADSSVWFNPPVFKLQGYGIRGNTPISVSSSSHGTGKKRTGFLLMGSELALTSWEPTRQELDKTGQSLYGSTIGYQNIPHSWMGLVGVHSLWLTAGEWEKMSPESRQSVKEWLMQGGHLFIAAADPVTLKIQELGILRAEPGVPQKVWLGTLTLLQWDGISNVLSPALSQPPISLIMGSDQLNEQISTGYNASRTGARGEWPLIMVIKDAKAMAGAIMIIMVIFAVIVGPVNLFRFARGPYRYRLFWTTPLIAITTSILLALLIFFKDGVGAHGNRLTFVYLVSEQNREVRLQEQCSLSGLLMSRRFKEPEPVFLAMVKLTDQSQTLESMDVDSLKIYSGDWFTSRSVQGHFLLSIRPTRARVEIVNRPPFSGARPPEILSSLDQPLSEIYFCDDQGAFWKTGKLDSGSKAALVPATQEEFITFMSAFSSRRGARIKSLTDHPAQKNHFYALSASPQISAIPTLSSVKWEEQTTFIAGPVAGLVPPSSPEPDQPSTPKNP